MTIASAATQLYSDGMNVPHPFKLTGLVALVTGGGRGLGLEIAKALADAGALVVVKGKGPRTTRQSS
jgi:gluconate 5-dehydrogenase